MTNAKFFSSRKSSLRRGVNVEWKTGPAGGGGDYHGTGEGGEGHEGGASKAAKGNAQQCTKPHDTHLAGKEAYSRKTMFEGLAGDVIFDLEPEKITCIKHAFKNGVSLPEFVQLMENYLPSKSDIKEEDLVANLIEFFKEMNLYGDAKLRWKEFVAFISEIGHSKIDSEAGYRREQADHEVHAAKEYRETHLVKDRTMRRYPVENIFYIKEIDKSAVVDKVSNVLKLYDSRKGRLFKELSGHTGCVLACLYLASTKYLVTSGADKTIRFWDQTYSLRRVLKTQNIQYSLCWEAERNILYSGDSEGRISAWDIETLKLLYFIQRHKKAVMALVLIKHLGLLVSASLDHSIIISDMVTGDLRQELSGHRKAILCLDYCPEYGLLVSSGFERDILGWNLFFKIPVTRFVGHRESIISVHNVPNSSQMVSADIGGNVRVWDVRTSKCMQKFTIDEPLSAFGYNSERDLLMLGTERILYYDRGPNPDPYLTSDSPPVQTIYNSVFNNFATASNRTVQMWKGETGAFYCAYIDVCQTDITAMCLGKVKRRLWVGDKSGEVKCLVYSNGAYTKSVDCIPGSEITSLAYMDSSSVLIASSMCAGLCVSVFTDADDEVSNLIHQIRAEYPTLLRLSGTTGLIAAVCPGGKVRVWEKSQYGLESDMVDEEGTVLAMSFLKGCMAIACSNNKGNVTIWATAPSRIKYKPLVSFTNFKTSEDCLVNGNGDSEEAKANVTALCFNEYTHHVCCGDDEGDLSTWDISHVLKQANLVIEIEEDKRGMASLRGARKASQKAAVASVKLEDYLGVKFEAKDVSLQRLWKAHHDVITDIQLIENPESIMTTSLDFRVILWDHRGNRLGVLHQGRVERPGDELAFKEKYSPWKFKCNKEKKREKDNAEINNILSMLHKNNLLTTSIPTLTSLVNEDGEKTYEMDEDLAMSIDSEDISVLGDLALENGLFNKPIIEKDVERIDISTVSKEDCSPFYTRRKVGCQSKFTSDSKPKDYAVCMLTLACMERGDPDFNRLISSSRGSHTMRLKHGSAVPYYLSGSRSVSPFTLGYSGRETRQHSRFAVSAQEPLGAKSSPVGAEDAGELKSKSMILPSLEPSGKKEGRRMSTLRMPRRPSSSQAN
eukprot:Nk52_evm11s553 gene=Nk52_evmTU11s553